MNLFSTTLRSVKLQFHSFLLLIFMQKYIKKINTRSFDKIILINTHEIYIIIMYAKIFYNSYWPFKRKKVRVVQFGPFLNHPISQGSILQGAILPILSLSPLSHQKRNKELIPKRMQSDNFTRSNIGQINDWMAP